MQSVKLYLSSYHLGNDPRKLAALMGFNKKIAIIPNALDGYNNLSGKEKGLEHEKESLLKIGLIPEKVDLGKYFGQPEKLNEKLKEFGAVWVLGGNTFILRRAYKESGFDKWLKKNKNKKDFVYAGYSAGICILSKDLKNIALIDDPNLIPQGYKPDVIWEGIGFLDYVIAPHYRSNHPESKAAEKMVEYLTKNNIKFKSLRDGEVLISDTEY